MLYVVQKTPTRFFLLYIQCGLSNLIVQKFYSVLKTLIIQYNWILSEVTQVQDIYFSYVQI